MPEAQPPVQFPDPGSFLLTEPRPKGSGSLNRSNPDFTVRLAVIGKLCGFNPCLGRGRGEKQPGSSPSGRRPPPAPAAISFYDPLTDSQTDSGSRKTMSVQTL